MNEISVESTHFITFSRGNTACFPLSDEKVMNSVGLTNISTIEPSYVFQFQASGFIAPFLTMAKGI